MKIVNVIVAIISGIIVLLGYFFKLPELENLRASLLNWALVLSGVAGLVAILNLIFSVHWKRVRNKHPRKGASLIIIISFGITFLVGIFLGPSNPGFQKLVTAVQVPIESSLMAILAITLVIASLKILQRQRNWMGFVFFVSVILFLILNSGVLAFTSEIPILRNLLSAFHQVPVAGARGILLGVALGSIVTGIRVLIGSDRPYNG
jgi:hypothetical protein